jgi:CHASE3 domain sensor protein
MRKGANSHMNKKTLSALLVLILLTSIMIFVFLGTLEMTKAANQTETPTLGQCSTII